MSMWPQCLKGDKAALASLCRAITSGQINEPAPRGVEDASALAQGYHIVKSDQVRLAKFTMPPPVDVVAATY